jgi:hypothetical protein
MADETERADEETADEKQIEDLDVPSEQADDVAGGVMPGRE